MVTESHTAGAASRGFRLGLLGMRLAGGYLGCQLKNLIFGGECQEERQQQFWRQSSRQFREVLQSLKGPLMKAGQMLSMQDNLLPKAMIAELADLQNHAPPMHPTLARAQFKGAFGKFPEAIFQDFELEPFAAASLGQVHRAVTKNGEPVVVKIQYPGMKNAIQNDFQLLRSAFFTGQLTGHIPKAIFTEVEQGILRETDYLNEGKNIDLFREKLAGLEYVTIPRVLWDYTTDRVLTMTRIEGIPLRLWLDKKPAQPLKNLLGRRLLEMFLYQIRELHAFHADPHPGNYLFGPDAQVGLVDFGCVKTFTPDFAELIQCFMNRVWQQDESQIERMLRLIWGAEIAAGKAQAKKVLLLEIELFNRVFPPPETGQRLVAFNDERIFQLGLRLRKEGLLAKLATPEFPFYSRAELGLYSYLRQLNARINTVELLP